MTSLKDRSFSVGEISEVLRACFSNPAFQDIKVYGEVYSIKLGKFSYIEIGDQGKGQTTSPLLKCAFRTIYGDPFGLKDIRVGDVIQVEGSLSYYAHGSSITLWGNDVSLLQSQVGKNLLLRKKTLEKLDRLGYLRPERKRKIPVYCKKVAIVTAANSAAYSDMMKTLHERFPVSTVLFPATVQGENAAKSMVKALKKAEKGDFDCILLGRGGGSRTDLSCFDDEELSLTIATSPIPVITCIGHTIDTAIADMVSDVKAITPTEGASLINPSLADVEKRREDFLGSLKGLYLQHIQEKAQGLEDYAKRLESLSPRRRALEKKEDSLLFLRNLSRAFLSRLALLEAGNRQAQERLGTLMENRLKESELRQKNFRTRLEAFNPEMAERMGYAVVFKDGRKVTASSQLKKGDRAVLTYADGRKEIEIQ